MAIIFVTPRNRPRSAPAAKENHMNHDEAQAAVLDRYPSAVAVYEQPEDEWVVRVGVIVLGGSLTRSGAWQEAAANLGPAPAPSK
jgi:hypothetical protein